MNIGEFVDEALAIKPLENDVNNGASKSPEQPKSRSTLTESQLLRMEENKRKAIEKRNQNVSQKKSLTEEQLSRMKENKQKALLKRSQMQKNVSSQKNPSGVDNESTPSKKFKFKQGEKSLEELCDENDLSWSLNPKFEHGDPKEKKSNPGNTKSSI